MVKKLSIIFFISFLFVQQAAHAEMDPRIKALGTMALYGTVGGALLGTAALAFDAKGRSVAIGASLGLYTGLLFGGYVVGIHAARKNKSRSREEDYYPDTEESPYQDDQDAAYGQEDDGFGSIDLNGPASHGKRPDVKPGQTYYVQLLNIKF